MSNQEFFKLLNLVETLDNHQIEEMMKCLQRLAKRQHKQVLLSEEEILYLQAVFGNNHESKASTYNQRQ